MIHVTLTFGKDKNQKWEAINWSSLSPFAIISRELFPAELLSGRQETWTFNN